MSRISLIIKRTGAVIGSGLLLVLSGCGGNEQLNLNWLYHPDFSLQTHCVGHYTLTLPESLSFTKAEHLFDNFDVNFNRDNQGKKARSESSWQWLISEKTMQAKKIGIKDTVIYSNLTTNPKQLVVYQGVFDDIVSEVTYEKEVKSFQPVYLLNFDDPKRSLIVQGKPLTVPDTLSDNQAIVQLKPSLLAQSIDINNISYKQAMFNRVDYCLNDDFIYTPDKQQKRESYTATYRSKSDKSYLEIDVESYVLGQEKWLQDRLNQAPLDNSLFTRSDLTVSGHPGKLYISSNQYSTGAWDFRWHNTDMRIGNQQRPLIFISGRIDTKDFPSSYQDNDMVQVIYWILKNMQVRSESYALADVK